MSQFFLVFEDLLDPTQKAVSGPLEAESREALANRLGLIKIPSSNGISPRCLSGDDKSDDVIIYIVKPVTEPIFNSNDLKGVAHRLHCDWY